MTERPILFSGPMVRAILNGSKTQTRRVLRPQPFEISASVSNVKFDPCFVEFVNADRNLWTAYDTRFLCDEGNIGEWKCPYGAPGDELWVRETWCQKSDDGYTVYNADGNLDSSCCYYRADRTEVIAVDGDGFTEYRKNGDQASPWTPSIHMPRWASRIQLRVTSVRVERLQEITVDDAYAEGASLCIDHDGPVCYRAEFQRLWDSIYYKRGFGWDVNPWVWVIAMQRIT